MSATTLKECEEFCHTKKCRSLDFRVSEEKSHEDPKACIVYKNPADVHRVIDAREKEGYRSENLGFSPLRSWGANQDICVGPEGMLFGHWQPPRRTFRRFFEEYIDVYPAEKGVALDSILFDGLRSLQRILWNGVFNRGGNNVIDPGETEYLGYLEQRKERSKSRSAARAAVRRSPFVKMDAIWIDRSDARSFNVTKLISPASQEEHQHQPGREPQQGLQHLLHLNVTLLQFESLSWESLTNVLANHADIIFSVPGAGFLNQMFLPRGTPLILLDCTRCISNQPTSENKPHRDHTIFSGYFGHHLLQYEGAVDLGCLVVSCCQDLVKETKHDRISVSAVMCP